MLTADLTPCLAAKPALAQIASLLQSAMLCFCYLCLQGCFTVQTFWLLKTICGQLGVRLHAFRDLHYAYGYNSYWQYPQNNSVSPRGPGFHHHLQVINYQSSASGSSCKPWELYSCRTGQIRFLARFRTKLCFMFCQIVIVSVSISASDWLERIVSEMTCVDGDVKRFSFTLYPAPGAQNWLL